MTVSRRLLVYALGLSASAALCPAQTMVEYAATAAISTAGGAGGKSVGGAVGRVFNKTGSALQKSAASRPASAGYQERRVSGMKTTVLAASGPSTPVEGSRSGKPQVVGALSTRIIEPPPEAEPAPASARKAVSAGDVAAIAPGASRQELLERIGAPAFRVRIQGDGHVQEIYRYSSGGADVGSVRVVDGSVTAVKPKAQ
jgi:Flp pilus assembly pilin Flp